MSDLQTSLGQKVGPLPAGAWAAAILGGLGISWYLRKHASSAAASAATDPNAVDTTTASTAPTGGTGGAAMSEPGNISSAIDTGGTAVVGEPVTTNAMWRQQAVKWLIGNGTGAIEAETAVANYLSGGTLSSGQAAEINKAVAAVGPTPDAVPTISVAAPTAPPATPTPNPRPSSNAQWRTAAINYMTSHGHSGVASAAVVDNYLAGRPIAAAGTRALNDAIRGIGAPPQPVHRDTGRHTHPRR